MREVIIERQLVRAVNAVGGMALKLVVPGYDGMPDRLLLLPSGRASFIEVKQFGLKPRAIQIRQHDRLRALGFSVYVLDDVSNIDGMIKAILEGGDAE